MCDKCKGKSRHWTHIKDQWSEEEKVEMLYRLAEELGYGIGFVGEEYL